MQNYYTVYSRTIGYIETVAAEDKQAAINKIREWYPQYSSDELFAEEHYDE